MWQTSRCSVKGRSWNAGATSQKKLTFNTWMLVSLCICQAWATTADGDNNASCTADPQSLLQLQEHLGSQRQPACTAANKDRFDGGGKPCCTGLQECKEPRPTTDYSYCSPSHPNHGFDDGGSCDSLWTTCRRECPDYEFLGRHGCKNYKEISLGNSVVTPDANFCARRCLQTKGCEGFEFKITTSGSGCSGGAPRRSCQLWKGRCEEDVSWTCGEQYLLPWQPPPSPPRLPPGPTPPPPPPPPPTCPKNIKPTCKPKQPQNAHVLARQITCPVIGALVKNGDLVPDEAGFVTKKQTFEAMLSVGISCPVAQGTIQGNFRPTLENPDKINVYEMNLLNPHLANGNSVEHKCSTGIRDGCTASKREYNAFESHADFSGRSGIWTDDKLQRAIAFYRREKVNCNDVAGDEAPGNLGAIQAMLAEFGTRDSGVSDGPFLSKQDMENLFMRSDYPGRFKANLDARRCK